ncbi:hypothetical protein KAU33_03410, partial [Candidatus Dependentiae bacterium]|nr:hypothetical protein [Candidatus Dependentiae bacterium]
GNSIIFQPNNAGTFGLGSFIDPDISPATSQFDGKERVVVSAGGDLYAYEPYNSTESNSGIIQITALSDPIQTYETVDKLYQPRWSEDGNKIVFIKRWPGDGSTVRESNVYVIENISNIIQTETPIANWGSTTLISAFANPDWSPSFSLDGEFISFLSDYNFEFNNVDFWTAPDASIAVADFDAYIRDSSAGAPIEVIEERNFNEGFMRWAPAGGDKFILIDRYSDTNKTYHLISFCDSSVGGFTTKKYDPKSTTYTLYDKARTSITVPISIFSEFQGDLMISVPEYIPDLKNCKYKFVGEFREFSIGGKTPSFDIDEILIIIHYTQSEIRGIKENNLIICKWNPRKNKWIKQNSTVETDGDGKNGNNNTDGGFVIAKTNSLGIFGIFVNEKKITKGPLDTLDQVRVFPNPYKVADDVNGLGVIIDKLPDNIDTVKIYNIAGDIILDSEDSGLTFYKAIDVPAELLAVNAAGGVLQWKLVNNSDKRVASGIYLINIKTTSGKVKVFKIAVIF